MAMSQRHYQAIADILNANLGDGSRKDVATELAMFFAEDNPRFDRRKFLAACRVDDDR